jgi:hypothetical protein
MQCKIEHRSKEQRLQEGMPQPLNVWADLQTLAIEYDIP